MSKINDLVTRLRDQAVKVKSLHTELAPLFTEAADAIEHLQRVGRERLVELEQVRLENDVLRMEKKR